MFAKVSVAGLFKIFGDSPQYAIELLERGASKEEVLSQTGNIVGLNKVSFEVQEGETFVVMGLSGSGKSTLIRCLNRLITPTAGSVNIDGEDILSYTAEKLRDIRRNKMSMVFQHFALFPHKTVAENVEYGLKVRNIPANERRKRALETLGLVGLREWADRYPDNLSGGMQQRVGLARGLATDPEIMLMDEAFSALDPLIRRGMQDELLDLQASMHKTIVFITHDLNEALKIGDRVAIMKDGAIVQIGTPEEIVGGPADAYVADFTQDVDRGRVFTAASVMRRAGPVVQGHDSVQTAMYRMREMDRTSLYVVNSQGKPVGIVLESDIARAVQNQVSAISQVMKTGFPRVQATAGLHETYELFTQGVPVSVVDDSGKLQGELDQLDVLANLAVDAGASTSASEDRREGAAAEV